MKRKKVTMEDIMRELRTIKKLVLKDLQLDLNELKIDKEIDNSLLEKESKKIFSTFGEWEANIWEDCKYKIKEDKQTEISYKCKLTNALCKFEDCPLNIKKLRK